MTEPKASKPRVFRVVVTMAVVEVNERVFAVTNDQLRWGVRELVIPFERIKAFNLDQILEDMVKETIDLTYESST